MTAGRSEATDSPPPGLELVEFVYEEAPFPQCHASTIAEASGGLVAAWFGGEYEKHPKEARKARPASDAPQLSRAIG